MALTFPALIPLGPISLHPHPLFETLAYFVGFRLYRWLRDREGDPLGDPTLRLTLMAATIIGAAVGAILLGLLENPQALTPTRLAQHLLGSGKSIVGGLLGGLILVELVKSRIGVRTATGDLYALPLAAGIGIGRIGCFLTGLADQTHGVPTALPWAVDFGDGIPRHPTQLYEFLFLCAVSLLLLRALRRRQETPGLLREGDLFKLFMILYLAWRLIADGIKPEADLLFGMGAIRWASLLGLIYYAPHLPRLAQALFVRRSGKEGAA